jgi:hypothetical protein
MSEPLTEEPIETLSDWNAVLANGCCCEMPSCPQPIEECKSRFVLRYPSTSGDIANCEYPDDCTGGIFLPFGSGAVAVPERLYRQWSFEDVSHNRGTPDPEEFSCTENTYTYQSASLDQTIVLTDPITKAELITEALAELDGETYTTATECSAFIFLDWDEVFLGCGTIVSATLYYVSVRGIKVQFRVPVTHAGSYFKIIFDVIEEPDGWDDETPTVFRSWYAKDVEREWTGPGTGDQDDPSWFLGEPYEIPPPTTEESQKGIVRRIVNRRFYCYPNSPYGFKPQIYGEGVTLPDP